MNLASLMQVKKGINRKKLNKLYELQFYTVLILVLTLLGDSVSIVAICFVLVIAMVRISPLFGWLNKQRYNSVQQSANTNNSFEQLDVWQRSKNYYDQYNLSASIASTLFDTLKMKEQCDVFELFERINKTNNKTLNTQIPLAYQKTLYKYLQQNPVMWEAGLNKTSRSKKTIFIPLSEIQLFTHYLLNNDE
jgi:hypothetical protein